MRVVVDTNVFVTALLHGPTPRRIYETFLRGKLTPLFSPQTLAELIDVLSRPYLRVLTSKAEVARFLALIRRDGLMVRPSHHIYVCRDSKDNVLLEAAIDGRADYIVTGDKDLIILHPFRGISILRPSQFIEKL